jgi:hypothetical protein
MTNACPTAQISHVWRLAVICGLIFVKSACPKLRICDIVVHVCSTTDGKSVALKTISSMFSKSATKPRLSKEMGAGPTVVLVVCNDMVERSENFAAVLCDGKQAYFADCRRRNWLAELCSGVLPAKYKLKAAPSSWMAPCGVDIAAAALTWQTNEKPSKEQIEKLETGEAETVIQIVEGAVDDEKVWQAVPPARMVDARRRAAVDILHYISGQPDKLKQVYAGVVARMMQQKVNSKNNTVRINTSFNKSFIAKKTPTRPWSYYERASAKIQP